MTACTPVAPLFPTEVLRGEPTLDELVASLWMGLAAHRSVACPICGAEMKPEYGAHARAIGGRCTTCGSTLY